MSAPGAVVVSPKAERGFRPDVQGLRAVAVSLVVAYHLFPTAIPGGYVGVDVFFVISGFLITGHLARTFTRTGRVGLVDFYGRRARRLMPAAVLVLVVTWLVSRVVLPTTQLPAAAEQIRASALYFQNWVLAHDAVDYLKSDAAASPVQHFWSLSVEEQFYLVWPLLFLLAGLVAWLVGRRSSRGTDAAAARIGRPVMFGLAVAVVVVSLAYSAYLTDRDPAAAYFVTTTRMWELGLGGALALLPARWARAIGRVGLLAWAGLALVVVSAFTITATSPFPGTIALLPVGGATLLIAAGSSQARLGPARLTSLAPVVFLGDISYSLYLWHWPVIVLFKAYTGHGVSIADGVVLVAASVVLAWLTKVFVEDTVRRAPVLAGHRFRSLATALIAIVPVVLVTQFIWAQPPPFTGKVDVATHPGAAALAGTPVPKASALPPLAAAANDFSNVSGQSCQAGIDAIAADLCVIGDRTTPTHTIALVGDSVAGQWMPALDVIGKQLHWKIVVDTHSSCAWTSTTIVRTDATVPYTQCQAWGRGVLSALLTTIKPEVVIVSDRPTYGVPGHPAPDATSQTAIGRGMVPYFDKLVAAGIGVVAIRETPEMGHNIPDCLSARTGSNSHCSVPASRAIATTVATEAAVQAMAGRASLVDLNRYICSSTCNAIVGNIVVYRDDHHLTKTYDRSLAPYLRTALLATPQFAKLAT